MNGSNKEDDDMSVLDQFSGRNRRNNNNNGPKVNLPARQDDPRTLRPEVLEAVSRFSEAVERAERMDRELEQAKQDHTAQVRALQLDLDVERRANADLHRQIDQARRQLEYYIRYAVEVRTHLGHVAASAIKANDIALKVAEDASNEAVQAADASLKAVEAELQQEAPEDRK